MKSRWIIVLLAILVVASVPASALAHPKIVGTEPPADAQLSVTPAKIRITFNEPIEAAFAELRVFDTRAQQVDDGSGTRSATDPATLELTPPALPGGLYTVVWQVVGSDGHKVAGHYSFTMLAQPSDAVPPDMSAGQAPTPPALSATPIAAIAPPLPADSGAAEPPVWLFALLRALMLMGAFGALGGWIALRWVILPALPANSAPARAAINRQWRAIVWLSAAALLIGSLGYAGAQAWSVAGQIDLRALRLVILETRLGQALLARALMACALLVTNIPHPPAPSLTLGEGESRSGGGGGENRINTSTLSYSARWPGAAIGLATLATFAASGHAAAEQQSALPIVVDYLHLLASATWVGGLVMLALALRRGVTALVPTQRQPTIAELVTRFSTMALGSVALVTITGTYVALARIPSLEDLWGSSYGQTLAIKLMLFGGMLLLGGYHLLLMRPRFSAWAGQAAEQALMSRWSQRFAQSMRAEIGLAALVLACVGVLTSVAPPERRTAPAAGGPLRAPTSLSIGSAPQPTRPPTPTRAPSVIYDEMVAADDLQVGLRIDPASLGENTIQVRIRTRADEPVEVQKVVLQLTMTSMDMGETEVDLAPLGDGVYRVPNQWLSMVGEWRVRVKIRRADADDAEVEFLVPIGG